MGALFVALADGSPGEPQIGDSLRVPNASGWGGKKDVGTRFTDGFSVLSNGGDRPITLLRVEQQLTGAGLEPLGAYVAGQDRRVTMQQVGHFPPRLKRLGTIEALAGAVIPVGETPTERKVGYELLLGYEVTSPGRSTRASFTVFYEVDGEEYQQTFPSTLAICAPVDYEGECEMEYGDAG